MQQINEKLIKINSKSIEQSLLDRLLYGKTIYFTNDYEARYLAGRYCNLTVMKLDANFLGVNLINSRRKRANGRMQINHQSNERMNQARNEGDDTFAEQRYEFDASDFVQHFGLTFRKRSPYSHLFAEQIITLNENGLIANLLDKWSRSSVCDSIRNGNLYSNSNDQAYLNLHNDRPADGPLRQRNAVKHNLLAHYGSAHSSMAKLKKLEHSNAHVASNHVQNGDQFRTDTGSVHRFYYATESSTAKSTTTRFGSLLSRLFKQLQADRASIGEYRWLNRIFYLLALGLSMTCLLVLGELFIAILTKNGRLASELDADRLDKHNRSEVDKQRFTMKNRHSTDKLCSSTSGTVQDERANTLVTTALNTNVDINNCPQHSASLNRPLIATISTTTTDILQHQLEQHQIEQSAANLFNNNDGQFGDQHFQNCDNHLFTSSNCPEHYAYHLNSATRFDNGQVSLFFEIIAVLLHSFFID